MPFIFLGYDIEVQIDRNTIMSFILNFTKEGVLIHSKHKYAFMVVIFLSPECILHRLRLKYSGDISILQPVERPYP